MKQFLTKHQLVAFFVLAYAFTWLIDFVIPQTNGLSAIGSYGPFFAAVVISSILMPEKIYQRPERRWILFGLVFVIAFSAWYLSNWKLNLGFGPFIGLVPSPAFALLVSGPLANRRGVCEILAEKPFHDTWKVHLAAVVLGPIIWLLPIGIDLLLGGQLPPFLHQAAYGQ